MTTETTVRAIVAHGAGDLRIEDVEASRIGAHDAEIELVIGGICGSDLHYFHRGGVGDFMIREPLILGHELVGRVAHVGPEVTDLAVGTRVAINPSHSCGRCEPCRRGERNLCRDGRFLGSAARTPHVQGGFRRRLVIDADQCVRLPDTLAFQEAAFAEPLAVAMHAVGRGGSVLGKRVLVTGAGPIGALIALVARHAGANAVVVTDMLDGPLAAAAAVGATETVNISATRPVVAHVDVAFEASGAPAALETCIDLLRPGGRLVLVGLMPPGMIPTPANRLVTRELDVVGSFRFVDYEFRASVDALVQGLDVAPLLSASFPLEDGVRAFAVASERETAMKVQIVFDET